MAMELIELDIANSHFSMKNVDSLASVLKHSKCTLTKLDLRELCIGAVELKNI